jgi:hypothetical protein
MHSTPKIPQPTTNILLIKTNPFFQISDNKNDPILHPMHLHRPPGHPAICFLWATCMCITIDWQLHEIHPKWTNKDDEVYTIEKVQAPKKKFCPLPANSRTDNPANSGQKK